MALCQPTCAKCWKGNRPDFKVLADLEDLEHGADDAFLLGLAHHVNDVFYLKVARFGDDHTITRLISFKSEWKNNCISKSPHLDIQREMKRSKFKISPFKS